MRLSTETVLNQAFTADLQAYTTSSFPIVVDTLYTVNVTTHRYSGAAAGTVTATGSQTYTEITNRAFSTDGTFQLGRQTAFYMKATSSGNVTLDINITGTQNKSAIVTVQKWINAIVTGTNGVDGIGAFNSNDGQGGNPAGLSITLSSAGASPGDNRTYSFWANDAASAATPGVSAHTELTDLPSGEDINQQTQVSGPGAATVTADVANIAAFAYIGGIAYIVNGLPALPVYTTSYLEFPKFKLAELES